MTAAPPIRKLRDEAMPLAIASRPRSEPGYLQFVDGNKRTGFVVGATFLLLNGRAFEAAEADPRSSA